MRPSHGNRLSATTGQGGERPQGITWGPSAAIITGNETRNTTPHRRQRWRTVHPAALTSSSVIAPRGEGGLTARSGLIPPMPRLYRAATSRTNHERFPDHADPGRRPDLSAPPPARAVFPPPHLPAKKVGNVEGLEGARSPVRRAWAGEMGRSLGDARRRAIEAPTARNSGLTAAGIFIFDHGTR